MSCVWLLQRGHSGDGCELASTLFGNSEAGKCLFRAADVWWRLYLFFSLVARCNTCVYIAHACFYIRCSVCGNVFSSIILLTSIVPASIVMSPNGVLVYCCFLYVL